MKYAALAAVVVIGFSAIAFAQETVVPTVSGIELPDPGVTPDSAFYFLKQAKESIQTFFTFGAEGKAKQFLHLAEVRLAEYQKMIEILRQAQDKKASREARSKKLEIAEKTLRKYGRQLNRALEKAEEAREKGKDVEKLKEAISEKALRYQEVLIGVLNRVPEEAKKGIENAIEVSQKGFENAIRAVTGEKKEELERKAEETRVRMEEKFEALKEKLPPQTDKEIEEVKTETHEEESAGPPSQPSPVETTAKPPISSEPTEIRYFTCPDGTKVESGKCYGQGETLSCMIRSGPELQCPAPTPPVTKGGVCATAGETKYYQCPNNTQTPWCVCGPESGAVGAKNVWRCQYLPELYCPKPVVAPVSPEMVACCFTDGLCMMETKEHCLAKNAITSGPSCSPNPCPQPPTPTLNPATDYIYSDCVKEGMKTYKCPAGNIINWKCSCQISEPTDPKYRSGGYTTWSCAAEPEKSCSLTSETPLTIALLYLKYYQPTSIEVCWATNKAIISRYVEYGTTASYGFTKESGSSDENKIRGCAYLPSSANEPGGLIPATTYHFRIIAEDAQGNKVVSDDYTFTTTIE